MNATVLWVTEEPPDRTLGGGNIRQAHLFEALASAFPTELLTVGPVVDERVRAAAAGVSELPTRRPVQSGHPIARRALDLAITLGSPYPAALYPAGPGRRALSREIASRIDSRRLVCIEHEALAPLVPDSGGSTRWLVTFHHLLSGMIASELELAGGRRQRWFRMRDLDKARRLERRTLQACDRCIVCSDHDAATLELLDGGENRSRMAVVPNGVDLSLFRPLPVPREPRVLLPGTLAWGPNVDGALWFCREAWPAVRAAVPEATLVLAGRAPVEEVQALGALPGVSVHADVPSMIPYFESARAVVVPLRVGTGTRLKALEAMAAGRPLVGTTIGLEGIGVRDGVHALVADEPAALVAALTEVLRRDDLAASLARSARAHVERHFGWDRIATRFVAIAAELMQ